MNDSANSNREYYRTAAALTLHYGPDTTQSREALALDQEVWSTMSALESQARQVMEEEGVSEEEKPLLKILNWLDFKLDLVLYHLRSQEHRQYFPYQGTTSEISGSGFGMSGPCELEPGSGMLFSLILPDAPWRPVVAVGEVVRTETNGEGTPPAVRFLEISDTDRERIIRFTFKKQRQELSRRAEEERT